jgi:hypothetical protein
LADKEKQDLGFEKWESEADSGGLRGRRKQTNLAAGKGGARRDESGTLVGRLRLAAEPIRSEMIRKGCHLIGRLDKE